MAISARFESDFESFKGAVDAEAKLKRLEMQSHRTAAGVGTIGPAGANSFTAFSTGLSAADKTLGAFGVHIGPEINALREMGEVSGKTASQVGLIGTASLAAAAAMAGWKIGRLVADFFDLDQKIGKATAKLLGWGDAAGQAAGAQADALAKASKTAGREITTMAEAMAINTAESKRFQESLLTSDARVDRFRTQLVGLQEGVRKVTAEQASLILIGDKANLSVAEMAKTLDLTTTAVQSVVDKHKAHQAALQQSAADAKKLADAAADVAAKYAEMEGRLTDLKTGTEGISPVIKQQILDWVKLGATTADIALKLDVTAESIEKVKVEATAATAVTKTWFDAMLKGAAEAMTAQIAMNQAVGLDAHGAILMSATAADVLAARLTALDAATMSVTSKATLAAAAEKDFETAMRDVAVAADAEYAAVLKAEEGKRAATRAAGDLAGANKDLALSFQAVVSGIQPTHAQLEAYERELRAAYLAAGIMQHDYMVSGSQPAAPTWGNPGAVPHLAGAASVSLARGGGGGSVVNNNIFNIVDTEANIVRRVSDKIARSVLQTMKVN